jgi:hypothetical protein
MPNLYSRGCTERSIKMISLTDSEMMFRWGHTICRKVREYTLHHNGGTFNTLGEAIAPSYGFAFSVDEDRDVEIPIEEFTDTTIQLYVMKNAPYITDYNRSRWPKEATKLIGTWVHDGKVSLSVVMVLITHDVQRVFDLAREHNQEAVYDFATKKVITI